MRLQHGVDTVRAVDVEVDAVGAQFLDLDAVFVRQLRAGHRRGDGPDRQALAYSLRDADDEPVRSRPGPEADAHAILDKRHRGLTCRPACGVNVHPRSVPRQDASRLLSSPDVVVTASRWSPSGWRMKRS